ncbi:hypothetical protein ACFTTN_28465 [Streptomyces niveus]
MFAEQYLRPAFLRLPDEADWPFVARLFRRYEGSADDRARAA